MSDPLKDLRRIADEVAREQLPTKACGTCRHFSNDGAFSKCRALGNAYSDRLRITANPCGPEGRLWEPKPRRVLGVIERAWRTLFGGREL